MVIVVAAALFVALVVTIGKFISERIKDKNLTQEQLASKLGVKSKTVSIWKNGKTMPDYSILEHLTKILEI